MAIEIPGIIAPVSNQSEMHPLGPIKNESKALSYIKAGLTTTLIGAAALACLSPDYNTPITGNDSKAIALLQNEVVTLEGMQRGPAIAIAGLFNPFIDLSTFIAPNPLANIFKWITPPPTTPESVLQITGFADLKAEQTEKPLSEKPSISSNTTLPRCTLKFTNQSAQRFEGSPVDNSTCPLPLKEIHKLYSVSPLDSFVQGIHDYAVQNWKSIAIWSAGLSFGLGATVYGTAVVIPAAIAGYLNQKKIIESQGIRIERLLNVIKIIKNNHKPTVNPASLIRLQSLVGRKNAALIPTCALESFEKVCELVPEGDKRTEFYVGFLNAQADAVFRSCDPIASVKGWLEQMFDVLKGAHESDGFAEAYAAFQDLCHGHGPLEFNRESQQVYHWDGDWNGNENWADVSGTTLTLQDELDNLV